ncbi:hypothetical protein ACQKIC_10720 [Peribacillus sp. NPDC046944]|uniref:hypothetical protein n=1 Tax=unclassified Peribacillus TaxID=2675266 RepID=UPI0038160DBB
MGVFKFNKDLPDMVSGSVRKLEDTILAVYKPIVFFSKELENHSGEAVTALKTKLSNHIEFFNKASVGLLYFADTVMNFVSMILSTDESGSVETVPQNNRAVQQYEFSYENMSNEIKLNAYTLKTAKKEFSSNLDSLNELLKDFEKLLNDVLFHTEFPWGDVADVWEEGKVQITFLLSTFLKSVEELSTDADGIIKELERVDNLIAHNLGKCE